MTPTVAVAVVTAVSAIVAAALAAWASVSSARVNHKLERNGGDSIGDAVHRIDVRTAVTEERVKGIDKWRTDHELVTERTLMQQREHERRLDKIERRRD